ncbi:MAG: type 1 glutamine amidotransferase [Kiritimatiellia bacterium]|jgi:GMP synthase-like glutamine amidotransferase|nr:type 1 glutamine amidotransferase [Kiritimatiellia bacterium]MDP6629763.1 type 1 glutamine amidotransferase [Kiritimatiellia bacterium]MDP6811039.1 type 1 glutamine amidotransferase [Kiritimatiellia bacterium]MDP7023106.1 type 1 glutamine amidotransferase [Kiritimatiellia bacterium]
MRAHYLQHVAFEGLGCIEAWLTAAGFEVSCTRLFAGEALPSPGAVDLLVIMGGPMSVHDEAAFPWLVEEKAFVRRLIDTGTPVLGVCLGAQLIVDVLGARVVPNREKEIGWFPVRGAAVDDAAFRFPYSIKVFHWHGETFDLPEGAVRLAESVACKNQAFQVGRSVIGLQFHLETTPESAAALATHCRDELVPGAHIQTQEEILAVPPETYETVNELMHDLLVYLTS